MEKISSKCESCGYSLIFNPSEKNLKCEHCGSTVDIPSESALEKQDYNSFVELKEKKEAKLQFECKNCGAKTNSQDVIVGVCPYCGSSCLEEIEDSMKYKPDGIVPFKISKDEAKKKYQDWIKSRALTPKRLKDEATLGKIDGMYVPCWNFEFDTISNFEGVGIVQNANQSISYNQKENKQIYETFIEKTAFKKTRTDKVENLLINANENINYYELQSLGHFGLSESLQQFNPAFLLGYKSSEFNYDVHKSIQQAKIIFEGQVENRAKNSTGFSEFESFKINTKYLSQKFNYIYLPIYKCNFYYNKKNYSFLINGHTGYITGEVPRSKWKMFGIGLGIGLGILGIVLMSIFL